MNTPVQHARGGAPWAERVFARVAPLLVPHHGDGCALWDGTTSAVLGALGGSLSSLPPAPDDPAWAWTAREGSAPDVEVGVHAGARTLALRLRGATHLILLERGTERPPFDAADASWAGALVELAVEAADRQELGHGLARARAVADAAAHRWASIVRLGALVVRSPDRDGTLHSILEGLVPYLGDWALVDLVRPSGDVLRVSRHAVPERTEAVQALRGFPYGAAGVLEGIRMLPPEGIVVESFAEVPHERFVPEEERALLAGLRPRSLVVLPLPVGGGAAAALTLVASESGQRYDKLDADLFRQMGKLAGLALTSAEVLEQAEYARQEREEVLALVSHDLKNPLNILSFAATILLQPDIPEDRRTRQLPIIERSVKQMTALINNLVDAARIDAGRFSVEPRPQDPVALAREALSLIRPMAQEAGVGLDDRLPEELPPIAADRERLLRVFSNLLANGITHTPRGGSVEVAGWADSRVLWFRVSDSGEGIEAEALPRIFDRFWQARRRGQAGAGLGLAIVHGIVTAHGGRIEVSSEPGQGTTFRFCIPLAAPAVEALAPT